MVHYRIDRALDSISDVIGIVRNINAIDTLNRDPKCFNFGAIANSRDYSFYKIKGGCCHPDENGAILGTIGEVVERYSASLYNNRELVVSDFRNLKKNAISPNRYALFHKEQLNDPKFPFKKFDSESVVSWFPMKDLTTGAEVYVPAQLIYMPFLKDQNIIAPNVSTGLAAHNNIYDAILNGLYEVIERDSFVLTWYQMLQLERIAINEDICSFINGMIRTEVEIHLFDMTTDLKIPSVLVLGFFENEQGRKFAIGSATRWTYGEAIKKAVTELIQSIIGSRVTEKFMDNKKYSRFSDITTFEDHGWYYMSNPETWSIYDYLLSTKKEKKIVFKEKDNLTTVEKIKKIVESLANKNYNVCVKDLTTVDFKQLGYHSVKIVVPQLLPLSGNYNYYFLGGERLFTVPETLGHKSRDYKELNPYPHPLP